MMIKYKNIRFMEILKLVIILELNDILNYIILKENILFGIIKNEIL